MKNNMLLKGLARLKNVSLCLPVWVWILHGVVSLAIVMAMAARTMDRGIGSPVPGPIRSAPFAFQRRSLDTSSMANGLRAAMYRDAARRSLEAVQRWEAWMDSLKQTAGGIDIYDSILLVHPGLLDTARMVEDYYLKQLK